MTRRIWTAATTVALIAGIVLIATAAAAQEVVPMGVELPIDTIYRGAPGDLFPVATIPAEPGLECVAVLESRNNESVHPNSDIIVGPVTFTNVETATFQAAGLTFISTGPISVAVRLGADGVFSAGFTLEVTCNPPTITIPTTTSLPSSFTTTTTVPASSSTTVPSVTPTTEPAPIGGIETGGGSMAPEGSPVGLLLVLAGSGLLMLSGLAVWRVHRA